MRGPGCFCRSEELEAGHGPVPGVHEEAEVLISLWGDKGEMRGRYEELT